MKSGTIMQRNWTVYIQVITHDRQLYVSYVVHSFLIALPDCCCFSDSSIPSLPSTVPLEVDYSGEAFTPLTGGGTEYDVP